MQLLAFDTSTEQLSVALSKGAPGVAERWQIDAPGGAKASAELISVILKLLHQADMRLTDLDAIAYGAGPGSFTGLRTACAVAQGLALGAGVPVLPVNCLLAVAECARQSQAVTQVCAALDARMDEIYTQQFAYVGGVWTAQTSAELLRPEQLLVPEAYHLAGNIASAYGQRLGAHIVQSAVLAWPSALAMLSLAPALLQAGLAVAPDQASIHYVRNKVALTTQERLAAKQALGVAE